MSGTEARRLVSGCAILAVALVAIAPAQASELRIGAQSQAPVVVYSQSITHSPGGGCGFDVIDGFWDFPAPLVVSAGSHRAQIVYPRATRPARVSVVASRALDARGKPSGPPDALAATLRPSRGPGSEVAGWRALFTVDASPTVYLTVATHWPRDRVCDADSESLVTYSLTTDQVRARSARRTAHR